MSDKQREIILYLFFGVTTTVVNIGIYQGLFSLGIPYWISNIFALILAKIYAYVVNKKFVFKSKCASIKELLVECMRFIIARGATGLIDYFGLIFAVEIIHFGPVISKYGIQIIVIVLNYIFSKVFVFRKKC